MHHEKKTISTVRQSKWLSIYTLQASNELKYFSSFAAVKLAKNEGDCEWYSSAQCDKPEQKFDKSAVCELQVLCDGVSDKKKQEMT